LILLDTNVVIHYLKGEPSVVARIQAMEAPDLAIPSVVAYELEYGTLKAASPRRRELVTRLLADSVQVPFDHAAASEAARIRLELERQSMVIGPLNLLIAGTAASRGAVLVTNNTKEFARVAGLRLADWTRPL
jgi:tRNA(fMet)-specific endonuclease VapC